MSGGTVPARADDLRSTGAIGREFVRHGSPRVLLLASASAVVARLVAGPFGAADAIVLVVTVVAVGLVEWVVHRALLHAPDESWTTRRLGTGVGHREHHLDPADLRWLLLRPVDAAVFAVLIAGFTAAWAVPLLQLVGERIAVPYLTALTGAWLALLHYEWTHLLVHSAHRPRSRFYRNLARQHRLHHYRNEERWLGITSRLGDRVMGTLPAQAGDVPVSPTARTLGRAPLSR